MSGYLEGSLLSAYSEKYMKTKLREHFGDRNIITTINGKSNVVTMRRTAESILFILEDIKAVDTLYDIYPSTSQLETESCLHYLPHSLRLLLEGIIKATDAGVKVSSIGQSIMQAARPHVLLAPLELL